MEKAQINWQIVMETAQSVGVPYFTRNKWRARSRIPAHWWPILIKGSDGKISQEQLQSLIPSPAPSTAENAA